MYRDMFGKNRVKLGLHVHTSISDGRRAPNEVAAIYKNAGYDAIAFADHWIYGKEQELCTLPILSGAEYNTDAIPATPEYSRETGRTYMSPDNRSASQGIFHILGILTKEDPEVKIGDAPQTVIDKIHAAGGLAVLAHPAWSLNTLTMITALKGFDATEIYNTVSDCVNSRRPDSSLIIDQLATRGYFYPLLATDDSHYYEGEDAGVSYIMAECDSIDRDEIYAAIKEERFYATQGPEIHLSRDGDTFRVDCSPCCEIVFMSNLVAPRAFVGDALTSAEHTAREDERYIRAYVTDKCGKQAWSNCIKV